MSDSEKNAERPAPPPREEHQGEVNLGITGQLEEGISLELEQKGMSGQGKPLTPPPPPPPPQDSAESAKPKE